MSPSVLEDLKRRADAQDVMADLRRRADAQGPQALTREAVLPLALPEVSQEPKAPPIPGVVTYAQPTGPGEPLVSDEPGLGVTPPPIDRRGQVIDTRFAGPVARSLRRREIEPSPRYGIAGGLQVFDSAAAFLTNSSAAVINLAGTELGLGQIFDPITPEQLDLKKAITAGQLTGRELKGLINEFMATGLTKKEARELAARYLATVGDEAPAAQITQSIGNAAATVLAYIGLLHVVAGGPIVKLPPKVGPVGLRAFPAIKTKAAVSSVTKLASWTIGISALEYARARDQGQTREESLGVAGNTAILVLAFSAVAAGVRAMKGGITKAILNRKLTKIYGLTKTGTPGAQAKAMTRAFLARDIGDFRALHRGIKQIEIVRLDINSTGPVLKEAYRALALKVHPDMATRTQRPVEELNKAFARLTETYEAIASGKAFRIGGQPIGIPAIPLPAPTKPGELVPTKPTERAQAVEALGAHQAGLQAAALRPPAAPAKAPIVPAPEVSVPPAEAVDPKLFHGTAQQPLGRFVDADGNLHIKPGDIFGKPGVSVSTNIVEATDFSTRVKGTPREKRAGMVFEIDADALPQAKQETETELSILGKEDVVIPKGKWRLVGDESAERAIEKEATAYASTSDAELAKHYAAELGRAEVHERTRADVEYIENWALDGEILRRLQQAPDKAKFIADFLKQANAVSLYEGAPYEIQELILPPGTIVAPAPTEAPPVELEAKPKDKIVWRSKSQKRDVVGTVVKIKDGKYLVQDASGNLRTIAPDRVKRVQSQEQVAEQRRLRQQITATAKQRGIGTVQFGQLKKTSEDLTSLLEAVKVARPQKVGRRVVITARTEAKIQTLKRRLLSLGELTEARFAEQVGELNLNAVAFINAKRFPTEKQGRELIRKMNDEAIVMAHRAKAGKALENTPGLRTHADGIDRTINARWVKRAQLSQKAKAFQGKGARYVASDLQEQTGRPFFDAWSGMNNAHLTIQAKIRAYMLRVEQSGPKRVMKDVKAAQRISDYIASKLLRNPAPYPKDITQEEISVAQEIETIFKEFEPIVRLARFMDYYYADAQIPNAPQASLERATDLYETQGLEALRKYLDTQTWGVIKKGYEPREAVTGKVSFAPTTIFGKGHIRVRSKDALAADKTIFQRLNSYIRQILNKAELEPQARAFVRVFDENMDLLADPDSVNKSMTLMIEEAKGFRDSGTVLNRSLRRLTSQAFRATFARPWMTFRNLWQNFAFNEDLSHGDLLPFRNTPLDDADLKYFNERVDQTQPLRHHFLMQEEKPLLGFRRMSRLVDRLAHYAWADKQNRSLAYWGRINRVRRALKGVDLNDAGSVKRAMDRAGFAGLELVQQRRALEIWAANGADWMTRYVAGEHVMNIHFAYERAQRSIVEMGTSGRTWANLMAFPRSWAERIYRESSKVVRGGDYSSRYRAVGRIIQMTIVPIIVGELLKRVAGKKRNPYNPLNILMWTPGGLVVGAVTAVGETIWSTLNALMGDKQALSSLPDRYSRLAKLYLPFYEIVMHSIESVLDEKNVDRKVARTIREAMSESYKVRDSSYEMKRTWVEAFQHAILGGRAAEKRLEREGVEKAKAKKANVRTRKALRALGD